MSVDLNRKIKQKIHLKLYCWFFQYMLYFHFQASGGFMETLGWLAKVTGRRVQKLQQVWKRKSSNSCEWNQSWTTGAYAGTKSLLNSQHGPIGKKQKCRFFQHEGGGKQTDNAIQFVWRSDISTCHSREQRSAKESKCWC